MSDFITGRVLYSAPVPASETTVYTCPTGAFVKIRGASLMNISGSAVTISVSLVKAGGTAGSGNRVASFSLAAGDSTVLSELSGHEIGPGDFVSAIASTASAVNFALSGEIEGAQ